MYSKLQSRSQLAIVLIISPLVFSFAFALDIYAPSIPAIKAYFHENQDIIQLTISAFLLITGIGQLFIGPFCDYLGRKKIVLLSVTLFLLGSVWCGFSFHVYILILGRIIQAIGACGMMVAAFAMVRDLFSETECAKIYSYLNSTIALSPLIAPLLGGYLTYWFNWRAPFFCLALIAFITLISSIKNIDETLLPENRRVLTKKFLRDYFHVANSSAFLTYTLCASIGFAGFLTFFSSSAYIIIVLLNIPEEHFGFYFALIGVVFFCGSILSAYSAKKIGTYSTVFLGSILMMAAGILMLLWYFYMGLSISGFMGPMLVMGIGGAFLMGAGAGGAISPFPEMAGTAAALFGSIQFVFAFIVSQVVLLWQVESTIPLALTLTILGSVACIMLIIKSATISMNKINTQRIDNPS